VRWAAVLRRILVVGAGALPLVVITLLYNREVTGALTQFPITAADPLDQFGLGIRRIMPGFPKANYTLWEATKSTAKNMLVVPLFLVGSYLGLGPAIAGWWARRREATTWLLVAIGLAFPAGYFWFWGMDVSGTTAPLSGPIYLIPAYAPLCVLMAVGVVPLLAEHRRVTMVGAVVLAIVTAGVATNRFAVNRRLSVVQEPWRTSIDRLDVADDDALVFVADTQRYLLYLNPFSANSPELDEGVLFAVDKGGANLAVIDAYPDRVPYLQQATLTAGEMLPKQRPATPEVDLIPLRVERGARLRVELGLTRSTSARTVVACVAGTRDDGCERLARGEGATTEWVFAPVGDRSAPDALAVGNGFGTITIAVGAGRSAASAAAEFTMRVKIPYRARPDGLTVLLPARLEVRRELENGNPYWRYARELPLSLVASAEGASNR
jgi:hypothetical protein